MYGSFAMRKLQWGLKLLLLKCILPEECFSLDTSVCILPLYHEWWHVYKNLSEVKPKVHLNDGVSDTNLLIISTTQIAKVYAVNHTTAVKAVSKLTDAGILYKKRGIGMCVAEGAREKITKRRKDAFLNQTIEALLARTQLRSKWLRRVTT